MQEQILFFGTVNGYKFGSIVSIKIHDPSGSLLTYRSAFPDKEGNFEIKLNIDSKFRTDGTYTAIAFADDRAITMYTKFYFSRVATSEIPDGAVITVDGSAGVVTIER